MIFNVSPVQFVVPGVTDADSSKTHVSNLSSGLYPYFPNRTVDGNFSQKIQACLHTADESGIREAWLRIDLQIVRSIKSVKFWYRNDSCNTGSYGVNCSKTCGHCNNSETCDIDTGECDDNGCALPGLRPPICDDCSESFEYGQNCQNRCSYHCYNNDTCDPIFGNCSRCASGYRNAKCDEKCNNGTYGENCTYQCGKCLDAVTCNHVNGTCPKGCKPGWQNTEKCDKQCNNGTYGENCTYQCGECLNAVTCNHVNGTCPMGCKPGWQNTDKCDKQCSTYEYGQNCQNRCSYHCYNNDTCDPLFGNCSRCASGYQNAKCDEECNNGTYGENCTYQCGECLNAVTCNHVNGTCPKGCKPGWQNTDKCDKQCNNGTYGENCTYQCGACLNAVTCNHFNGTCPKGCKPGWQTTDKCDKPCRNGTFGINCMYNCSGNCERNDTCDRRNGSCVNCAPGWENQHCNKTCDVGSYGSNCEETCGRCLGAGNCSLTDGNCLGGCQEGFTGDNCHERIQNLHNTPDAAVIAAPVVATVVLITVIVVVVILRKAKVNACKRRKRKKRGIQLHSKLVHTEKIANACRKGRQAYFALKIREHLSPDTISRLYTRVVLPSIVYGCELWDLWNNTVKAAVTNFHIDFGRQCMLSDPDFILFNTIYAGRPLFAHISTVCLGTVALRDAWWNTVIEDFDISLSVELCGLCPQDLYLFLLGSSFLSVTVSYNNERSLHILNFRFLRDAAAWHNRHLKLTQ
uniref:EGF-like domain-containing protein n=1 Tax=Magallana gigas TaxID=29159 RepID=A0A8W8NL23_MAGGI